MTTTEPDPIAQAIAALTAAARGTKIRGAGTPHEQIEQADFADLAAHVLTSVAANLGGAESLLAGRPGSWEADVLRQLINGTAPEDEIHRYRTEPVRITVFPEGDFQDLGLADLFGHDLDQAIEEQARDDLSEEQETAADRLVEAIERLWERDLAAYAAAYLEAARAFLEQRGIRAGVEAQADPAGGAARDPLIEELHQHALKTTPLPMTGKAPDWSEGTPADALRRAGLTYLARAQASDPPH